MGGELGWDGTLSLPGFIYVDHSTVLWPCTEHVGSQSTTHNALDLQGYAQQSVKDFPFRKVGKRLSRGPSLLPCLIVITRCKYEYD